MENIFKHRLIDFGVTNVHRFYILFVLLAVSGHKWPGQNRRKTIRVRKMLKTTRKNKRSIKDLGKIQSISKPPVFTPSFDFPRKSRT